MICPYVTALNGLWEFFYTAERFTGNAADLPGREKFIGTMPVPGYWDDHYEGIENTELFDRRARFNPEYRVLRFPMGPITPDASTPYLCGTGFYRKAVRPGAEFSACSFKLRIGPAVWGSMIFCNRKFAGSVAGYSTSGEVDLTPFWRSGEENEIILVVTNLPSDGSLSVSTGQNFRGCAVRGYTGFRAGIGDGVKLIAARDAQIVDWYARYAAGDICWHVFTRSGTGKTLRWSA